MNFTPVDNTGRVDGYCLVKNVEVKTSSKGDTYLDFTLGDSTGEINGKLWRYNVAEHGEYKANDLVKIRGTISQYNGADQLRIERIRPTIDSDNVHIEDFVRTSGYSSEQMYDELMNIANSFADNNLKLLVTTMLSDNRENLLFWPAAFKLHHALRGGLLMHTLSIVRLCEGVCNVYPFIDRELLLAGAILHDISKIDEFDVNDAGVADGYTIEGNLLGHISMGATKIDKYAERLGVERRVSVLLQHMILSHHGEPEFGAVVRPMFIEAEVLSELDLMDARIFEMREAVAAASPNDFSARVWALDNRKLFNHTRSDLDKNPKLF
ncbi:MAG: HD domain-containing protein [Clostridia bacterium]|nr:HD domain-containing protein [Clostridia bacterium]